MKTVKQPAIGAPMPNKFGRYIRFRGTSMCGMIVRQMVHNGERVYRILWEKDIDIDPRPYTGDDLEPTQREDRMNLQIIKRAHTMDRKAWEERLTEKGTVKSREGFRGGDGFERI